MNSLTGTIIEEAQAIVTGIESAAPPLSRIALRARRLARLLDDDAAFMWLSLECSGASKGAQPERDWKDWSTATRGMEKYVKLHAVADFANSDLEKLAQQITTGKAPEAYRDYGRASSRAGVTHLMGEIDVCGPLVNRLDPEEAGVHGCTS
jgi:hypothetical protein